MALNCSQAKCDVLQQANDDKGGPGRGEKGAGRGGGGWRGSLGEAGVGAARVAVFPLPALHHAGDLQACHHREAAVPHLQGAAHRRKDF